jgi:hypothetical protein
MRLYEENTSVVLSAAAAEGPGAGARSGKKYAFTQFAYPPTKVENVTMPTNWRQGYSVRSNDGFRYTEYVAYDPTLFKGSWTSTPIDAELYDLNTDAGESINAAADPKYATKVHELMAVLRSQYTQGAAA